MLVDSIHADQCRLRSSVSLNSLQWSRDQNVWTPMPRAVELSGSCLFDKTGISIRESQHITVLILSSPTHLAKNALFSFHRGHMNHWLIKQGHILLLQSPEIAIRVERSKKCIRLQYKQLISISWNETSEPVGWISNFTTIIQRIRSPASNLGCDSPSFWCSWLLDPSKHPVTDWRMQLDPPWLPEPLQTSQFSALWGAQYFECPSFCCWNVPIPEGDPRG